MPLERARKVCGLYCPTCREPGRLPWQHTADCVAGLRHQLRWYHAALPLVALLLVLETGLLVAVWIALASIQVNRRGNMLGRYATEREAAQAYDRAAVHYFGKGAKLNFPKSRPRPADAKALRAHARAEHKKTTHSRYRGVSRHSSGRWSASICREYRNIFLGVFLVEEDAAEAYDKAARRLRGKAVKVNFG